MSSTVQCVDFSTLTALPQEEALQQVLASYSTVGLQATQIGRGRDLVNEILYHRRQGDRVFLAYTSNLISCGLRDTFAYLARERLVDAFISSAGGVEEDVIKCLGDTLLGKFTLDGKELRRQGFNRIGNLLVPNDNYGAFEEFFMPVLKTLHQEQRESRWTCKTAPSDVIAAMGEALGRTSPDKCESSLVYWCYKNNIPMFSPALTDGSMGDMIYFHTFSRKGLVVDPIQDVLKLRQLASVAPAAASDGAVPTHRNSAIVLGAGIAKHNLLRNIAMDRAVLVTTGNEADGCTSSCTLEDDVACGLLRAGTEIVRIQGDATFVFPLLLTQNGTQN